MYQAILNYPIMQKIFLIQNYIWLKVSKKFKICQFFSNRDNFGKNIFNPPYWKVFFYNFLLIFSRSTGKMLENLSKSIERLNLLKTSLPVSSAV